MKVKELIKELEKLNLEEEITITYDSLPVSNEITIYYLKKDESNKNPHTFNSCYMMTCQDYSDVKGHKEEKIVYSNRDLYCHDCFKSLKLNEIHQTYPGSVEFCKDCFRDRGSDEK